MTTDRNPDEQERSAEPAKKKTKARPGSGGGDPKPADTQGSAADSEMSFYDRLVTPAEWKDRFVENLVIASLIEIRLQTDRQPNAMIGVGHLIDVLQFSVLMEEDAIWHGAPGFLLAQRM